MASKDKIEEKKKRSFIKSTDNETTFHSFSCKFTPPYTDKDALSEKIRIDNILGELPFSKSSACLQENQDDTNIYLNQLNVVNSSMKSNSAENTKINIEKITLEEIFKKMQLKPLLLEVDEIPKRKAITKVEFNLSEDETEEKDIETHSIANKSYEQPLIPIALQSPKTNSSPESIKSDSINNKVEENINDFSQRILSNYEIDHKLVENSTNKDLIPNSIESENHNISIKFALDVDDSEESLSSNGIKISAQNEFTIALKNDDNNTMSEYCHKENFKNTTFENKIGEIKLNDEHTVSNFKTESMMIRNCTPQLEKTTEHTYLPRNISPGVTEHNSSLITNNVFCSPSTNIELDKNGKPTLLVSIELDLLLCSPELFTIQTKNQNFENKSNFKHIEYEINLLEKNTDNKSVNHDKNTNHKKSISPTCNYYKRTSNSFEQSITNTKKCKHIYNESLDSENDKNEIDPDSKHKIRANPTKFSITSVNPTAIVKPISIPKPLKPLIQNDNKGNLKQKLGPKFDFVENKLSVEVFHHRGINKKHEADQEREFPVKKITLYMEAVCNFCLCAVLQHRLKKTKTTKPVELLNQTWKLLKHVNENYVRADILNPKYPDFVKKFKVLSNWMESFIFHWLWRLNINECKKLSQSLNELLRNPNNSTNKTPNSIRNSNLSPGEAPSSPNSVCSAGSQNGNLINETKPLTPVCQSSSLRELQSKMKNYININDYNLRSYSRWDINELLISEDRQLQDFRETIEGQVQFRLGLYREVEDFASSVLSGLQLLQLST